MKPEKQTRKDIIDKKLQAAGWILTDRSQVVEEYVIKIGLPVGVKELATPNIPPITQQDQFIAIANNNELLKRQYKTSSKELEYLYGSLSQRALKGDLNMKGDESFLAAEPSKQYGE